MLCEYQTLKYKPMLNHVTRKHHTNLNGVPSLIKRLDKATNV
jgi:hypothetical protein